MNFNGIIFEYTKNTPLKITENIINAKAKFTANFKAILLLNIML